MSQITPTSKDVEALCDLVFYAFPSAVATATMVYAGYNDPVIHFSARCSEVYDRIIWIVIACLVKALVRLYTRLHSVANILEWFFNERWNRRIDWRLPFLLQACTLDAQVRHGGKVVIRVNDHLCIDAKTGELDFASLYGVKSSQIYSPLEQRAVKGQGFIFSALATYMRSV